LKDVLGNGQAELKGESGKFSEALRQELRELCKTNLYALLKIVLGYDQLTEHLHYHMCDFVSRPPSRFSLLMAFRGGFKSTIGTVGATVQEQIRKPQDILIFSEASLLAESWSREARVPFEGGNPLFSWLFPELTSGGKNAAKWGDSMWQLPHGGRVYAAGIDSGTMGLHTHWILMDDVFSDPKGDKTPEYADRVLQFVKMSAPLLKNPATDKRRLTGVRWWVGEGEPYGYFQKNLPKASQFILPLIQKGECIWPERFPPEELQALQSEPFVFASQYLLDPVSNDTAIFKRGVIKTFDQKPEGRNFTRVAALDPAFSKERRAHHSAMVVADNDAKGNTWIVSAEKKKLDATELKQWVVAEALKHNVEYLAVEVNGPQLAFFQELQRQLRKYPMGHPARKIKLVELRPVSDKVSRWNALASGLGSGQVRIYSGLTSLITEMYRVTGAKHEENDLTDAAAHLVGPELTKKKPMRLSELSEDALLPHALQEDPVEQAPRSWMAS
jgi:hypothetical protein